MENDIIIIGSGPAGGWLAKKLSDAGRKILLLEQGNNDKLSGDFSDYLKVSGRYKKGWYLFDKLNLLIRGITIGGSSSIYYATAMSPPKYLKEKYGITLDKDIEEIKSTIKIAPFKKYLIGPRANLISNAAKENSIKWYRLDKFITSSYQESTSENIYSGYHKYTWNIKSELNNINISCNSTVTRILHNNEKVIGVEYIKNGKTEIVHAEFVVLSAGGIGSPSILQKSGIGNKNKGLFIDPVILVSGISDKNFKQRDIPMSAGVFFEDEGITLSDLQLPKMIFSYLMLRSWKLKHILNYKKTCSIMVKIADDDNGIVNNESIKKTLTISDENKFNYGYNIAKSILDTANCTDIIRTSYFAAHQGGTVKIGEAITKNLETNIKNLYVCDNSIIPEALGIAPTLTILAFANRLANYINHKYD